MPLRSELKKVLLIGAGPIVIGQACEFDYSGTQACKALREEGIEVVLVNSNPATIMTDPEFASRTYIEPLTGDTVAAILRIERPDAVLPTLGGQTALNVAIDLAESGVLEELGIELIGAQIDSILMAEDRSRFREAMAEIGLTVPRSRYVNSVDQAADVLDDIGLPAIIRPSFTLGGSGGAIANDRKEFEEKLAWGLHLSPRSEVLVEQSVLGWKEFELEVMRDGADNVVIICSIENLDPMGVHTGDSITVAPAQTLTDKEYQRLRDASVKIIRKIGVDTGGSNIQFAVNPATGDVVVIEMNPRVSRSSALASKATGFPIAKIAAKLAIGYTLDEIPNDITKETPASFEPTIDYVVTKIPRFAFEKFPDADATLGVQMKSVGEAMSIGRTFRESLQKGMRSLEIDRYGFEESGRSEEELDHALRVPGAERLWMVGEAFRRGRTIEQVHDLTKIDPWFLHHIREITREELRFVREADLARAKRQGFSDRRLAALVGVAEKEIRERRQRQGVQPVFKRVDTCGAEFEAHTPYLYSTYEAECEADPSDRKKVMILGGGPNRIGQGIEFDYCCVHGVMGLAKDGYETIMVNCNPETVSTDYDTSDRLYFEPLTLEDVLAIVRREKPDGVIVQFGGQTPLRLAVPLEQEGVPIIGTPPDAIDRAEDRERFAEMLNKLGLNQPDNGTARSVEAARRLAENIGYPVLVRPSYVLGGRAMQIVHDESQLDTYMREAVTVSPEHPVLIDRFLANAIEVDVDAICDGEIAVIAGIMEHIEEAGIHSGDSACSLPPYSLPRFVVEEIRRATRAMAVELGVRGLMNVQFGVVGNDVYVIEVNPRASRTVPFVSKAIGVPLAQLAARVMAGKSLRELGFTNEIEPAHVSVKESVFPFVKFPGVDTLLGPEMKSTGEVMGIDREFGRAYAKAQRAAGNDLPISGTVLVSMRDEDKTAALEPLRTLHEEGFRIVATGGTARAMKEAGLDVEQVNKVQEGSPHTVDLIASGVVDLVVVTTRIGDAAAVHDSASMRRAALENAVPYFTTVAAARAAAGAIRALRADEVRPLALQDVHPERSLVGAMSRFASAARAIRAPLEFVRQKRERIDRVQDLQATLLEALDAAAALWIPPEATRRLAAAAEHLREHGLSSEGLEAWVTPLLPILDEAWPERVLAQPTERVPGIGPKTARALARKEIHSIEDLLFFLPRSYEDRREIQKIEALQVGHNVSFEGHVTRARVGTTRNGRKVLEAVVSDGSAAVQLKWFRGVAHFESRLRPGVRVLVAGDVRRYRYAKELHHPEIEVLAEDTPLGSLPRIVPAYAPIEGVPPRTVRRLIETAVRHAADLAEAWLPEATATTNALAQVGDALRQVHQPGPHLEPDALRERRTPYHLRLVAEELFLLQVGLELRRAVTGRRTTRPLPAKNEAMLRAFQALPFELTGDQKRAWDEIATDLSRPRPMHRMLIGDVGTGKTVLAVLGAVAAHAGGGLSAVLAPTEILAEQHYTTFRRLARPLGLNVALLTGSTSAAQRRSLRRLLALGEIAIVIGTHALLTESLDLPELAFVVIDEQHRFGVAQRRALGEKGQNPHVLLMSATPIPRSLALTVFGDLDHSVIRERPPGRQPVTTRVIPPGEARSALQALRDTLDRGEQAYVVYPLVEESEKQDLKDASRGHERLARALPGARVALLHGRMDSRERLETMQAFAAGDVRVLVSTTVIEVGVDVPEATLLIVQHAERFGLAQLHQLRGRVGRGDKAGHAILIAEPRSEDATRRLSILESSESGFDIAEEDLRIRGAGEWLGTRQAGHLPELRLADLVRHGELLPIAREAAQGLVGADPGLEKNVRLRAAVERRWGSRLDFGATA